eukprot:403350207
MPKQQDNKKQQQKEFPQYQEEDKVQIDTSTKPNIEKQSYQVLNPESYTFLNNQKSMHQNSSFIDQDLQPAPTTTRRLMIESIVLENFKSYFGKNEIGPLHKSFSAVVGPNGSGKSNLIECLLFVFGKRAKQMRSDKLQQLIHNSALHPNVQSASVKVRFTDIIDDENEVFEYERVPNTQFEISRTVYRNSNTRYFINGEESSFKDVCELLKKKGIDLDHNRFLILQGEVEQISLMPPKGLKEDEVGLLEYLEDIIGTTHLKPRLTELEEKLKNLDEEKSLRYNTLSSLEDSLKSIESEKDKAIDWLNKQRGLYQLQNMMSQVQIASAKDDLDQLKDKIQKKRTEAKEKRDQKQQFRLQNEEIFKQINKISDINKNFDQKKEQLQEQFKQLSKRDEKVRFEMRRLAQQIEMNRENIRNLELRKENEIRIFTDNDKDLPQILEDLREKHEELENTENEYDQQEYNMKDQTMQLREKKKNLIDQIRPHQQERARLQQDINTNKRIVSEFDERKSMLNRRSEDLEQKLQELQFKVNSINDRIGVNTEQIERLQAMQVDLEKSLQNPEVDVQQLERDLERKKTKLKIAQDTIQKNKQRNINLSELMNAQRRGELSGIYGRLGDLGQIDMIYDTAITTASKYWDFIVVDTMRSGERCVEYLNQNRIGYQGFIMLDKQNQSLYNQLNRPFRAPQGSKRLIDLIQVDKPELEIAFYFAIRDTLVCEDLDTATRIAYYSDQKYRVVTLDGTLIELTGTMSGGGKAKRGGMNKQFESEYEPEYLQQLQQEIERIEALVIEHRDTRPRLEYNYNQNLRQINNLEQENRRSIIEVQSLEENLQRTKNQYQVLVNEKQELDKEEVDKINPIKIQIGQAHQHLVLIQPKIEELQQQLSLIETQIYNMADQKLKKLRDNMERLKQEIIELQRVKAQKENFQDKFNASIKNIDRQILEEQKLIDALQVKMDKYRQAINQITLEGEQILNKQNEIDEEKDQATKQLFSKKQDFRKFNELMSKNTQEYEAIKQEVLELSGKIFKLEEQLLRLQEFKDSVLQKCDALVQEWQIVFQEIDNVQRSVQGNHQFPMKTEEDGDGEKGQGDDQEISAFMDQDEIQTIRNRQRRRIDYSLMTRDEIIEYLMNNVDIHENFDIEQIKILEPHLQHISNLIIILQQQIDAQPLNSRIIEQYQSKSSDLIGLRNQIEQRSEDVTALRNEFYELKQQRIIQFKVGFEFIAIKLKEIYRFITKGGDAELELVDAHDPFSDGISFHVRPLKKSWKEMKNLSGGEKTISSLALIFALHHYKPSPLYCMDEIDAALDYKNVAIVGEYIKQRTRNGQFLVISLRNNMFELAEKLFGIYKTKDMTKTVYLIPSQMQNMVDKAKQKREILDQQNQRDQFENDQDMIQV